MKMLALIIMRTGKDKSINKIINPTKQLLIREIMMLLITREIKEQSMPEIIIFKIKIIIMLMLILMTFKGVIGMLVINNQAVNSNNNSNRHLHSMDTKDNAHLISKGPSILKQLLRIKIIRQPLALIIDSRMLKIKIIIIIFVMTKRILAIKEEKAIIIIDR